MSFRDIVGQDRAVRILQRTIRRGRVPSSYLFAGESGIGKKLTALTLAKTLNCMGEWDERQGVSPIDSCDTCPSCRKIDRDIHPDVQVVSPDNGQIRVEEIRAVEDLLSLKAFEGRVKTVIVDSAETMNPFAANAFLKTLEEPPPQSLIVLVASNPERLPDTIRSRCSRINFVPLSLAACRDVIQREWEREKVGQKSLRRETKRAPISPSALDLSARLAMGRPGTVAGEDSMEQRARFLSLLKEVGTLGLDGWSSREEMEKWFDFLLSVLRDVAIMKITGRSEHLMNADLEDEISAASMAIDLRVIIERYRQIVDLRGRLHFNLNKSLTWNYTGVLLGETTGTLHG